MFYNINYWTFKLNKNFKYVILYKGGVREHWPDWSITVWLVSSFYGLDSIKQENVFLFVRSKTI